MSKKIYLYVKTHKITGLKYFGKTHGEPFSYKGSGVYWKRHLKMHGEDLETTIIGEFLDEDVCKKVALEFSIKHDIVKSKEWANLKIEELDGGWDHINSKKEFKRATSSKAGKACHAKHPDLAINNIRFAQTTQSALKGVETKKKQYGLDYFKRLGSVPKSEKQKQNLSLAQKDMKMINLNGKNTFVKKDKVDEYIKNGWKLGKAKNKIVQI